MKIEGKRTPRQGAEVQHEGETIGRVTSGCLSPTLGYPIAMAYLKPNSAATGDTVGVAAGSSEVEAELVPLPFYKRSK
ncbi:MAG: glycine cleavage T C-terminal barrel domain-containing protein [Planctomycetota bacterium]